LWAIGSDLLELAIGVSGDRIVTGLALYDALTQIEQWAEGR
jgi:hypothetical protein